MPLPPTTGPTASAVASVPLTAPVVPGDTAGASVLELPPGYRFFLVHHRDNWDLESEGLEEPALLPQLQRVPYQPGTCGFRTIPPGADERVGYQDGLDMLRRKGFTPLAWDLQCGGLRGYLAQHPCRDPRSGRSGYWWTTHWERPRYKRVGARQKFSLDRASWNRWRLALVEEGILAGPHPDVVAHLASRLAYHADRHQAERGLDEESKAILVERLRTRAEVMTTAIVPEAGGGSRYRSDLRSLPLAALRRLAGPLGAGLDAPTLVDLLARARAAGGPDATAAKATKAKAKA